MSDGRKYERKILELDRYGFLRGPEPTDGVVAAKGMGNWIDYHEATQIAVAADAAISTLEEEVTFLKAMIAQLGELN